MKKFELTFTYRDDGNRPKLYDRLESDSLTQLLSQFMLTLAKVSEMIKEQMRENRYIDDDIPF